MYIVNILFLPIDQTTYFSISNAFRNAKISNFIQFYCIFAFLLHTNQVHDIIHLYSLYTFLLFSIQFYAYFI